MASSFLQAATSTTDASSYTFSAQNIGTAAADRYIVCATGSRKAGAATTLSVSIGGVGATEAREGWNNVTNSCVASLDIAAVPTGTTGDVVLTFGATMVRTGIALYRLDDLSSATPSDTDSVAGNDPSMSLDIPNDGVAIASAFTGTSATSTWSGVTERNDSGIESASVFTSGHDDFASGATGQAVAVTFTSDVESIGVVASWGFGAGVESGAASSAGTSTATGVGASIVAADFSSTGSAAAIAVGATSGGVESGDASSTGTSTATAAGGSIVAAAMSSSGASTATAVGSDASAAATPTRHDGWMPRAVIERNRRKHRNADLVAIIAALDADMREAA